MSSVKLIGGSLLSLCLASQVHASNETVYKFDLEANVQSHVAFQIVTPSGEALGLTNQVPMTYETRENGGLTAFNAYLIPEGSSLVANDLGARFKIYYEILEGLKLDGVDVDNRNSYYVYNGTNLDQESGWKHGSHEGDAKPLNVRHEMWSDYWATENNNITLSERIHVRNAMAGRYTKQIAVTFATKA
ncbi:hypothetical protein [Vibrio metschnikovii]|uniref:hypothetical protein n=1 Tax=Vibrio metschnikovii TaxID=28172 RepID=UPI00164ADCA0|nr:hypothetical protein [Vibrio metschnikovii]MBC5830883.1 hypothetical protein [Vibrio metschnikovii]